jgi:hypothetical protein
MKTITLKEAKLLFLQHGWEKYCERVDRAVHPTEESGRAWRAERCRSQCNLQWNTKTKADGKQQLFLAKAQCVINILRKNFLQGSLEMNNLH